jgi:hypothetical protein
MSTEQEQEQVLVSDSSLSEPSSTDPQQARSSEHGSAAAVRGANDGPRRRIVVAQKPAEKPIALISRDTSVSDAFEEQLGRSRTVVVFPSLTHFCSDSSRMVWGGVVVARSCGWDERLLSFVPSTTCIAFWRLAEEGYGWPASVRRLDTQEDVRGWLEDIAKPLAFQLPRQKRGEAAAKRSNVRQKPSKPQLKFELATARGVVAEASPRARVQETPLQMEFNGLSEKHAEQKLAEESAFTPVRSSVRPTAARATEKPARGKTPSVAPVQAAAPARRRGRPPIDRSAQSGSLFVEAPRVSSASVLRMPSNLPQFDERGFMKLAAELGLARARDLLDELRVRAHSLR